jgi:hypothetical protein
MSLRPFRPILPEAALLGLALSLFVTLSLAIWSGLS